GNFVFITLTISISRAVIITFKVEFTWDRVRLFDQDIVQALDTVELEKLAVRKLKMSAKHAMDVAERLYNKGYISYPRTETNKFPPDINLSSLLNKLTSSALWGDFANEVCCFSSYEISGPVTFSIDPGAWPESTKCGSLQGDDWRIYELIVRHFLACLSWDAKGQETRVDLRIGGEIFHATGLYIQDLGYLRIYPYERWSDKTLPSYVEGEHLHDYQLRIADGQTQPPELLNEADLIALMDKYGIGTDATHAEHIEKIKTRQYVGVREDGRFIPGYLGLALVDGYDAMGIWLPCPL
ncbi:unnamed protein product, partial [Strongylus vulgaris]